MDDGLCSMVWCSSISTTHCVPSSSSENTNKPMWIRLVGSWTANERGEGPGNPFCTFSNALPNISFRRKPRHSFHLIREQNACVRQVWLKFRIHTFRTHKINGSNEHINDVLNTFSTRAQQSAPTNTQRPPARWDVCPVIAHRRARCVNIARNALCGCVENAERVKWMVSSMHNARIIAHTGVPTTKPQSEKVYSEYNCACNVSFYGWRKVRIQAFKCASYEPY